MGRGLAILAVFAVAIGVFVYWGPLQLSATTRKSKAAKVPLSTSFEPESSSSDRDHEPVAAPASVREAESDSSATAPVRKTGDGRLEQRPREAVLASTPPLAASALAALPEKGIPGFPRTRLAVLSSDQLASAFKQAKFLRADGKLVEARDLLSDVYLNHRMTHEQRMRLADELEPLSFEILRSHSILEDGQLYEVEPGDVLVKIARPFRVPPEFVMKINGIKRASSIRPRQELKLVQGPFDVLAELAEFELTVLHHGKFVRLFSIGIGTRENPTPTGLFKVGTKLEKPAYFPTATDHLRRGSIPPGGIPSGDPDNPLGSRWIDIGLGYGIHGTNEPDTVGRESSRGCIRLRNEDVEEVYDMLTEGSRVLIR
jgi:hypothetical protein